ncbi:MAG TPA: Ldh family oxidoreductase [Blastocatellia bacterium]|nr:Ldh family oxidoreductase [Blastocatellia bacterium]
MSSETAFSIDRLLEFATRVFLYSGVAAEDAPQAAEVLVTADAWGIDTHGVARLRGYYETMKRGLVNPRPNLRVVREMPACATLDGDNGLGLIVGPKANQIAMEKAETVGAGWVSVCHTNHFGIAGYYPWSALKRDLIGWAMTNSTPQVAPLWGTQKMLGTNPIAIAFPGHEEPPVIIDMATSTVAYGKIENAVRKSETVPLGWIIDSEGEATIDPEKMVNGGALVPLGHDREHGGHKGYCLGAMVDLLCGALSGANWGPFVPPFPLHLKPSQRRVGKGIGHFFGALKIDAFIDPDEFKRQIDEWVRVFRAAKPAAGTSGPLIPGDPERQAHARHLQEGVRVLPSVARELRELSALTGIPLD